MWCGCQKHNKERFIAESAGKKVLKSANIRQSCNQEGGCLVHWKVCNTMHQSMHRRNHSMGPVGRVPSNFGDRGDQVYLVPVQLLSVFVSFSLGSVGSVTNFPSCTSGFTLLTVYLYLVIFFTWLRLRGIMPFV